MPAAFVTAYYQSTGKSLTVHGHAGAIEPVGFPSFSSFLHSALHCVVIFVTAVFSSTPKTISITWCFVRAKKDTWHYFTKNNIIYQIDRRSSHYAKFAQLESCFKHIELTWNSSTYTTSLQYKVKNNAGGKPR